MHYDHGASSSELLLLSSCEAETLGHIDTEREITDQNLSNRSHRLWNSSDGTAELYAPMESTRSFVQDAGMLWRLFSRT